MESKSTSSSQSASRSQPKSSSKSAQAGKHGQTVDDLEEQTHQEFNTGNDDDKFSRIWSPEKVVYDKHAYWGTYPWGPKRQKFYGYASNMETSKDVYSRHRIVGVTSLKIMKTCGRSAIRCRKLPEEDQPQRPNTYCSDLRRMTPYTAYPYTQGIIYEDEMNRNRLMRTDELHKFSDGTLNHVRTALNDIATGIGIDYLPKQKWSKQDKKRACVMINVVDRKLRDRRVMHNLEKFVGGRPYRGGLRLLDRTI
uniref:Uncharacterized protein n=1 Tax=Tanacetum cinerariifolium TaxID=118510 RepID=A0A6L2MS28_TANCI|nr:hypothetical protein [Tanacetum cinerariifolium]